MSKYYGVRGSNYVIKDDGTLWEIGTNRRFNINNFSKVGTDKNWAETSSGNNYAFGIKNNGTLWAWGSDFGFGSLGMSTLTVRLSPIQVGSLSNWNQISCGYYHTMAIKTDGTLWSWGGNSFGQLGLSNLTHISSPVQVGASAWAKAYSSYLSSFAITSNGTLWAWGYNTNGQLGLSNLTNRYSPTQVGALTDWFEVSSATDHTLAIKTDGTLWAWGANNWGQLGLSDLTNRLSPVQVGALTNWADISTGTFFSVALQSNGTLWSWGINSYGQLGLLDFTNRSSPVQVGTLSSWNKISVAQYHSLALKTDGTLWSWGSNSYGKLGYFSSINVISPTQVPGLGWQKLSTSNDFSSAIKNDGSLWTAGANSFNTNNPYFKLGYDIASYRSDPVQVGSSSNWSKFPSGAINDLWSAVIDNSQTLYTFGDNGTTPAFTTNYRVVLPYYTDSIYNIVGLGTNIIEPEPLATNVSDASIGYRFGVYVKTDGTLWGWGITSYGQITDPIMPFPYRSVFSPDAVKQVSSRDTHTVIVNSNGTLWTQGSNSFGQLGVSNQIHKSSPVQVGYLSNWSQVGAGQTHSAAISADGELFTWGNSSYGQLGRQNLPFVYEPISIGSVLKYWNQISCGPIHGVAIQTDGTLWSWGANSYGSLGLLDLTHRSSPVQVGSLSDWSKVAAGVYHTAAIKTDGTLWTWGNNSLGQLGISTITHRSSPGQVGSLSDWSVINAGASFSVALKTNGTLWSWGANQSGQLGQSNTTHRSSPVQVGTLTDWSKVSATAAHVAAIKTNGTLWVWGTNNTGQLGLSDLTTRYSPVQVGSLTDWNKIYAGQSNTAAIKTDGTLWIWGENVYGQLGQSNLTARSSPVQVGSLTDWNEVVVGNSQTIALKTNGSLWSWGSNVYGQLGNNTISANYYSPVQVGTLSNWAKISSMGSTVSVFALNSSGVLWTWGNNTLGILGQNDITQRSSTVQVGWDTERFGWTQVSLGQHHTLSINTNGSLWSWGGNSFGQLGTSDLTNRSIPVLITTDIATIRAGRYQNLAIKNNGTLWAWGDNGNGQLGLSDITKRLSPVQIGISNGWTDASTQVTHSVGINNGYLYAWGSASSGQLGRNDPNTSFSSPVQVIEATKDWASIAPSYVGHGTNFLVKANGTLWASGANSYGHLGLSQVAGVSLATQVGNLSNWNKVYTSENSTLATKTDGTLWAWGSNGNGQLGLSDITIRFSPVQVGTDTNWSIAAIGRDHAMAIKTDGSLWGWGYDGWGQLGLNSFSRVRVTPVQIGSDTNWSNIVCTILSSFGLKTDGTLWAWGYNANGQLGISDTNARSSPVQIGTDTNWSSIACGYTNTIAVKTDGTLWTWGYNGFGQLGLNTTTNYSSPMQVGTLSTWSKASMSPYHSAAIKTDGTLWMWGYNNFAQLGLSYSNVTMSSPVQVGTLSNWSNVSCGYMSSFALKTDNTVWSWGYNTSGQFGVNNATGQSYPILGALNPQNNWSKAVCGYNLTLASKNDGTIWSWGSNTYGALGTSNTAVNQLYPLQIGNLSNWSTIPANAIWQSNFATNTSGDLYSWGNNTQGQLGRLAATIHSPIQLSSTSNWSKVAAGSFHFLAIDNNNALWSQGYNNLGQLGLSNSTLIYSTITQIGTLSNWSQIACGYAHSVALKTDGTLWTWGSNFQAQLGQGDYTSRSSPVQVGAINTYYKLFSLPYTVLAEIL
jgi:alpha-tubulin suppressor-like RCC1 family protein